MTPAVRRYNRRSRSGPGAARAAAVVMRLGVLKFARFRRLKNFRAKLKIQVLSRIRVSFMDGKIPRGKPRPNVRISSHVSEKTAVIRWRDERVGIEPLTPAFHEPRACKRRIQKLREPGCAYLHCSRGCSSAVESNGNPDCAVTMLFSVHPLSRPAAATGFA